MPTNINLLRDQAYKLLLDMVISGELHSEDPLSERKLAERLSMGRTPVREALRALVRDGVMESQVGRGTFVRRLTPEDVRAVYQTRQALEGMAAFLAAKNGPTKALAGLGMQMKYMREHSGDYSRSQIDEIGAEFHRELFMAADNPVLLEVFEPLRLRFQIAFGLPRHNSTDQLRDTLKEHLAILEAVERGDGPGAQAAMWEHLEHGLQVRLRNFEQMDDSQSASPEPAIQQSL